jgi:hypothetical protein
MDRVGILSQAGAALCGPAWKNPMSRVLGPYSPDGPRDHVDPRLVRRWAAGARPIPDWVLAALADLLRERSARCAEIIPDIERVLREGA